MGRGSANSNVLYDQSQPRQNNAEVKIFTASMESIDLNLLDQWRDFVTLIGDEPDILYTLTTRIAHQNFKQLTEYTLVFDYQELQRARDWLLDFQLKDDWRECEPSPEMLQNLLNIVDLWLKLSKGF